VSRRGPRPQGLLSADFHQYDVLQEVMTTASATTQLPVELREIKISNLYHTKGHLRASHVKLFDFAAITPRSYLLLKFLNLLVSMHRVLFIVNGVRSSIQV
jgi:hypothetical protein